MAIKDEANKKVSWKSLIGAVAFVLSISGMFILYSMAAEKTQNEVINDQKITSAVMETKISMIQEDIEEIKEAQQQMMQDQIKPSELGNIIWEAVRDAVKE